MMKLLWTCLIATVLPTLATAEPLAAVGVGGVAGAVDCRYNSSYRCNWMMTDTRFGYDVLGTASFTARQGQVAIEDARGHGEGRVEIDPSTGLAVLKTSAFGNASYVSPRSSQTPRGAAGLVDVNVFAVQGFRYTGLSARTVTLTAHLHSEVVDANRNAINMAGIGMFRSEGYRFAPEVDAFENTLCLSDLGTLNVASDRERCEETSRARMLSADSKTLRGGSVDLDLMIQRVLNPGEEFFISTFLFSTVCCGLSADASQGLRLAFDSMDGLKALDVPLSSLAIPEPAGLALTALALLALGGTRYRLRGSARQTHLA